MPIDAQRVKALFVAALELPDADARRAFLDRECAGDAELRRRLDALVQAHDQPESALERPLAGELPTGAYEPRTEAPGLVIAGRYKLLESIGAGGMGEVWVAEQTQPVRRKVALKLIKAGMDSKSVLARFEAERQALAMMDHPNIAKVLDGGVTEAGRPYFVMEYVKGVPITEYCDAARLDVRQRLELFAQVCQAVQHAHQKGIIHRDLKPSNILVAPYDDRPVPKVIDFGLAKAMHQALTERTLHTAHEAVLGTPLYMSPEQAQLNNLDVDTRSDVYSLGVLLYELLTGTTPVERGRLKQAAWDEVRRIIREEEPPRPSTRLSSTDTLPSLAACRQTEPAKLTRLVRGEIDWIVMKALEKDRNRRYETANGFAADVLRYLAGEPVQAVPPSAGYRLRKFVRRNRGPVLAGTAFTGLLVVAAAVSSWLAVWAIGAERSARASERQAVADAQAAREARDAEAASKAEADARRTQAELSVNLLASVFDGLDPDAVKDGGPDLRQEVANRLDATARRIESNITDPLAQARLLDALGVTYLGLGYAARAVPLLERSAAIRATHEGPAAESTLSSRNYLAAAYRDAGRAADAKESAEGSLQLVRRCYGPKSSHEYGVLYELASALIDVGRPDGAIPHLNRLLAHLTAEKGPDDSHTIQTLNALALAYEKAGRVRDAIPLYEDVRDRYKRTGGPEHLSTLTAMNNLAGAYKADGRLADAMPLLEEVANIRKAKLSVYHPATLVAMNNLALAYRDARRLGDAIPLYEQVLKYRKQRLGEGNPDSIRVRSNLGVAYEEAYRWPEAAAMLKEALDRCRKKWPENPDLATYMNNLARLYGKTGRRPEAIQLYGQALALNEARLPADHPDIFMSMNNLAAAYWQAGNPVRAIPLFEQALRGLERTLGQNNPETLQTQANLGVNLFDAGRRAAGIQLLEDAVRRARARPGPAPVQLAWLGAALLGMYRQTGLAAKAELLLRDDLQTARDKFPAGAPDIAGPLARLGIHLLDRGKFDESELLLRECLAIRQKLATGPKPGVAPSQVATTKGALGRALAGQRKFQEAEPLFLDEYAGLVGGPPYTRPYLRAAVDHLIELYDAWGKPEKAAEWRAKRPPELGPPPREVKL